MSHAQRCAILSGRERDTTMSQWNFLTTELASLAHEGLLVHTRTMVSAQLFHASVLAQAVTCPTVPRDTARLRVMLSAAHTRQDLECALETFAHVGRAGHLIPIP